MSDNPVLANASAQPISLRIKLEGDLLHEMERTMAESGFTTKSAWVRKAILNEIAREKRQKELDALEWEEKVNRVRSGSTGEPFPDSE